MVIIYQQIDNLKWWSCLDIERFNFGGKRNAKKKREQDRSAGSMQVAGGEVGRSRPDSAKRI